MSDLFQGGATPTHVPAPAALPKQDGSYAGGSIAALGMQQHPNPLPAETPTTAKPVEFTAPVAGRSTVPDNTDERLECGTEGPHFETGPLSPHHAAQVAAAHVPGMSPVMEPKPLADVAASQVAGTQAGRAVVNDAEQSKFAASRLIRLPGR